MIKTILIVGKGSVGSALGEVAEPYFEVHYKDPSLGIEPVINTFDLLHITFPLTDKEEWINHCNATLFYYNPTYCIVNSTIVPGILPQIQEKFPHVKMFYAPIRAHERAMKKEWSGRVQLIAPLLEENLKHLHWGVIRKYYKRLGIRTSAFRDAEALVLGKLMAVNWFGMNIAFAQQMRLICNERDINFDEAYTRFSQFSEIGSDYSKSGKVPLIKRPVFRPDVIGGKCVIQDVELALKNNVGDPTLWWWLLHTNEQIKGMKKDE